LVLVFFVRRDKSRLYAADAAIL